MYVFAICSLYIVFFYRYNLGGRCKRDEEIEYPWRKMRHENSIENWHEGGRDSIGGHRDLRVNGRGARHVLQALDVILECIGHKGLGLHAHVLMIEL